MPATILKTYLRLNLLELGGDDTRLQKLEAAASELADGFAAEPKKALPIFLATMLPDQGLEGQFSEVANAIESQWATYHGAFQGGSATTLYKAVALQALVNTIEVQPVLGTAISLLMRNFGPVQAVGKNKAAIELLVDSADAAFDAESEESNPQYVKQSYSTPKIVKPLKYDRAVLKKRIEAAVGPSSRENQACDSPNQHWPNAGAPWSYDFADRLAVLFADYLDDAVAKASQMDAKNIDAFGNNLNDVATDNEAILTGATSLLWWRQALYSESAEQPYRELPPTDTVVHAVIDLSELIPSAYERALESFLMEAILSLIPSKDEITASQLLENVAPKASSELRNAIDSDAPTGLLISAIVQKNPASFITQASLSPHKWAVWLLRELMAIQAWPASGTAGGMRWK